MVKSLTTQHETQESSPPKTKKKKSSEHGSPLVILACKKHREGIPWASWLARLGLGSVERSWLNKERKVRKTINNDLGLPHLLLHAFSHREDTHSHTYSTQRDI